VQITAGYGRSQYKADKNNLLKGSNKKPFLFWGMAGSHTPE
jgi:hypothetical protein